MTGKHKVNRLIFSICRGDLEDVQLLVEEGTNVNCKGQNGRTPVMTACYKHRPEVLNLLLALAQPKVKLNISDRTGCTALHLAVEGKNFQALQTLLTYCQDWDFVNSKNKKGMTAITLAAAKRGTQMLTSLIKAGADLEIPDNLGCTPLMHACNTNGEDILRCLVLQGAALDAVDSQKRSALHHAARKGNHLHTEILLSAGASIELLDSDEATALVQALWKNQREVVTAFLNSPRCSILCGSFGTLSAFDLARKRGNKALMSLLFEATKKELLGLMRACGVQTRHKLSPDLMCIIAEFAV